MTQKIPPYSQPSRALYLGCFTHGTADEKIYLFVKNQTKIKGLLLTKEGHYEKIKASQIGGGFQGELSHGQIIDLIQKKGVRALYSPQEQKKILIFASSSSNNVNGFELSSTEPPPPNPHFVDRKNHKNAMHHALNTSNNRLAILTSEEGVNCKTGKTELAKDYALTYRKQYEKVIWVEMDQPIDPQLLLWLKEHKNWLLVLNNVTDKRKLKEIDLANLQKNGHILLTTRQRDWQEHKEASIIPVDVFSLEEAVLYLSQQLKNCSSEVAQEIAATLGYVPTSLQKAVQQIQDWDIKPESYLDKRKEEFKSAAKSLKEKSNLPPPHETFVGREAQLVGLEETLDQGKPLVIAAEVGLGGIGKSLIASELALRLAQNYRLVWWINCENETTLVLSYISLAGRLGISLSEEEKLTPDALFSKVNHYLQEHPGCLLIFDDANDPIVRKVIPKSGVHALITSRSTEWEEFATVFKIGVFKTEESADLLMKITQLYGQEKEAAELGVLLENLPLAVAQAARYIAEVNKTKPMLIAEYIDMFKQQRKTLWKVENPPKDLYRFTVSITLSLAIQRILEKGKQENIESDIVLPLLRACSLLGTREVPRQLVFQNWLKSTFGTAMGDSELNEALGLLNRYSIIELTQQRIHMHSLVQLVVQDTLSPEELRKVVGEMYKVFHKHQSEGRAPIFAYWDSTPATVNQLYWLQAHGLSLAAHAESVGLKDEAVELLLTIGCFSYHQGNFQLAENMLKRSLTIRETAGAHKNLGNVCLSLGRLDEAKMWYEKCNDHDGFILLLIQHGKLDEAEKMLRADLAILDKKVDPIGTTNVKYYKGFVLKHLATVLLKKNDPNQALVYLLKSRQMFREIYSTENTFTSEVDYLLAQAYGELHDPENQEKCLNSALNVYLSIIQTDNPNSIHQRVMGCLKALGQLALKKQNFIEADKKFQQAIHYSQLKHGAKDTSMLLELAGIYYDLGKLDQAIESYEAVIKEKDDQNSFHNLGCLHQLKGNAAQAEVYFKRALNMKPHSGTFVEHANFLCLNKRSNEAVEFLLKVINAPDDGHGLVYGVIEIPSLPGPLQNEVKFRGTIQLSARYFAYFLLIHANPKGKDLCGQFEQELSKTGKSFDYNLLGYCYKAIGDGAKAKAAFQRAVDLDPKNQLARENL